MSQATSPRRQRRHLHFDALIQRARRRFEQLPEQRRCPDFSLADTLMAGLALFSLKDPSLLAFCRRSADHNLRSVFGLRARLMATPHATPKQLLCHPQQFTKMAPTKPAFRGCPRRLPCFLAPRLPTWALTLYRPRSLFVHSPGIAGSKLTLRDQRVAAEFREPFAAVAA